MFNLLNYSISKFNTWMRRGIAYNKASEELYKLTDRELHDLGIYRCEIPFVIANTLKQRIPSRTF